MKDRLNFHYRKIIIALLGNYQYDTRTFNLIESLESLHMDVRFIGFDWMTPGFQSVHHGKHRIIRLHKHRFSWIFYLQYSVIEMLYLFRFKSDIVWAADFYSLPFCYLASKLYRARLYYDSREIYTEIRGIASRSFLQKFVRMIEGYCIKRCDAVLTTGIQDTEFLAGLFKLPQTRLLRNLPKLQQIENPLKLDKMFSGSYTGKILVYQGTLVRGRGISTCLKVVQRHPDCCLLLLGGGEDEAYFRDLTDDLSIADRVCFAGKVPQQALMKYTAGADIGLALIENISQSNALALPNKLFEYIMAGIPVIATDLPQMREVIKKYHVGAVVREDDIEGIVQVLRDWENPETYARVCDNCRKASRELNWEGEFEGISDLFDGFSADK